MHFESYCLTSRQPSTWGHAQQMTIKSRLSQKSREIASLHHPSLSLVYSRSNHRLQDTPTSKQHTPLHSHICYGAMADAQVKTSRKQKARCMHDKYGCQPKTSSAKLHMLPNAHPGPPLRTGDACMQAPTISAQSARCLTIHNIAHS